MVGCGEFGLSSELSSHYPSQDPLPGRLSRRVGHDRIHTVLGKQDGAAVLRAGRRELGPVRSTLAATGLRTRLVKP